MPQPSGHDPLVSLDIEHASIEQLVNEIGRRVHGAVVIVNAQPPHMNGIAESPCIYIRGGVFQAAALTQWANGKMRKVVAKV